MPTSQQQNANSSSQNDEWMKIAVVISLLRSKLLHNHNQNQNTEPPPSESDALRWKRKAKERKQELLRLREDIREAEVRLKGRRRRNCDSTQHRFTNFSSEDEVEHLRALLDFLVELCDAVSLVENANFASWSHQAMDFILASLKNLLSVGRNMETIEGIIDSLTVRLVRRMCSSKEDDPSDDAFPNVHACMFLLIQLIEFLILDYLLNWASNEGFDNILLEEWVKSVLHAWKAETGFMCCRWIESQVYWLNK